MPTWEEVYNSITKTNAEGKYINVGYMNEGEAEYSYDWDTKLFAPYTSLGGRIRINIEYDKTYTTPTEAYCRFRIECPNESKNSWNWYYVLIDPKSKSDPGTLIKLKGKWTASTNGDFPYYSTDYPGTATKGIFKLTKDYNESTFKMPPIWIINDGMEWTTTNIKKDETWAKTFYTAYTAGGKRYTLTDALVYKCPGKAFTANTNGGYVASDVGAGEVSIEDNGDNSFTITAIPGAEGKNNKVKSATLTYYKNGTEYTKDCTDGAIAIVETIPSNYERSLATFPVSAKVVTKGTYGNNTIDECATSVVHYRAPDKPGIPVIRYEKNRLTTKENWRYFWDEAQRANINSPVVGYHISIFKNTAPLTKLGIYRGTYNNDSQIILDSNNPYTYVDFDHCPCNIYFNPKELGFEAKDSVRINISAYTINGKGTKLFGESVSSETLVIQNAGVIRVKVNGGWKEGQVYVKISGHWKEAETVQTKVNGKWRESE